MSDWIGRDTPISEDERNDTCSAAWEIKNSSSTQNKKAFFFNSLLHNFEP